MSESKPAVPEPLSADRIEDLKLAGSHMLGEKRRAFQAAMTEKYCGGSARRAEHVFGRSAARWRRHSVESGLHERRTGLVCVGAQEAFCGRRLWEECHPEVADALWRIAEAHSRQDPSFRTTAAYTRLTAAEALNRLRAEGFGDEQPPSPSTLAEVLNRNGYRLRKVLKAKPRKKSRTPMRSSPTSPPRTASR